MAMSTIFCVFCEKNNKMLWTFWFCNDIIIHVFRMQGCHILESTVYVLIEIRYHDIQIEQACL